MIKLLLSVFLFIQEYKFAVSFVVNEVMMNEDGNEYPVFKLASKGDVARVRQTEFESIRFFCYDGIQPNIFKFWSSASFKLEMDSVDYKVYIGPNVTTVNHLHQLSESSWWYTQLPWRSKEFKINPFQDTCVGVRTARDYTLGLQVKNVNYLSLLMTVAAVFVYFSAPKLCRNQFFHYTTGISAGILMSILILTYIIHLKVKSKWLSLLYPLSVYFITNTWYNLKEYLTEQYFHWVLGYLLSVGVISFCFIYRMGAPSNPKTLNLIQWTMQGVSLVCVVLSSHYQVASLSIAIVIVTWSAIPANLKSRVRTQVRKRLFRPKIKLLTEEEYQAQRNEETRKALDALRNYCRSPESKPWHTVTKLTSPTRFAEFVEGSPHITEQEVMDYSHWDCIETDDEDEHDTDELNRSDLTDDEDLINRSLDSQADLQT